MTLIEFKSIQKQRPLLRWGFCIFLLAAWLTPAYGEEISCHKEEEIKDGGKHIVDLKLILEKHLIKGLVFDKIESFADKGNPMAVWACSIDTTRLDTNHRIKWSRKGTQTAFEISEKDTRDTSRVRIENAGKGYTVFFEEMSRYYSGMTEFPRSIFIGKSNTECTVTSR
jgi:hypothetical protein